VLVIALALTPLIALAECVHVTGDSVMADKTIELVFSGRVVEVTPVADGGVRATFDVQRVWKGSIPQRFDLYVWWAWAEIPHFEKGQHHVVLAQPLTDRDIRQKLGMVGAEAVAFRPTQCSVAALPSLIERELGAGYAPKRP
jgi:hypothetical protein